MGIEPVTLLFRARTEPCGCPYPVPLASSHTASPGLWCMYLFSLKVSDVTSKSSKLPDTFISLLGAGWFPILLLNHTKHVFQLFFLFILLSNFPISIPIRKPYKFWCTLVMRQRQKVIKRDVESLRLHLLKVISSPGSGKESNLKLIDLTVQTTCQFSQSWTCGTKLWRVGPEVSCSETVSPLKGHHWLFSF